MLPGSGVAAPWNAVGLGGRPLDFGTRFRTWILYSHSNFDGNLSDSKMRHPTRSAYGLTLPLWVAQRVPPSSAAGPQWGSAPRVAKLITLGGRMKEAPAGNPR